jgi:signal peptidase II
MKNNKWLRIILVVGIALFCLICDQITKLIAINNLVEFKSVPVIDNFFYWTLCYNTGGAWSIFSDSTWILAFVSMIALGFVIFTLFKSKSWLYTISASVFMGRLVGNLLDRLIQGKVTDFLDFVIFGYDFPVFNVADICICVSAAFIVLAVLKEEKKDGKEISE